MAKVTDSNLSGSDTNENAVPDDDEEDLAEIDVEYRGRGRPKLDPGLRRREKLVISLTADELRRVMLAAANHKPVPLTANEWARREILRLAGLSKAS